MPRKQTEMWVRAQQVINTAACPKDKCLSSLGKKCVDTREAFIAQRREIPLPHQERRDAAEAIWSGEFDALSNEERRYLYGEERDQV